VALVNGARPVELPDRAALGRLTPARVHAGGPAKAVVSVFESGGRRFVVKDVRAMHPWARHIYGRRVLRREERALRALDGVVGVPRLLGRIDADALALEYVDGEPLRRDLDPARLRRACSQLGSRIDGMHERGVVHLDLRQKRNLLIDAQGDVFLVDFQSAWVLRRGGALFRLLAPFDRSAVLKFQWRYAPDLLDERQRRRARRAEWLRRFWIFHRFGPLLRFLLRGGRRRPRSP
jgi:predicted Ser/Thr protein kinase